MERLISIGEAAAILGVTPETLREWEKQNKITVIKTIGNHRRYFLEQLLDLRNADSLRNTILKGIPYPPTRSYADWAKWSNEKYCVDIQQKTNFYSISLLVNFHKVNKVVCDERACLPYSLEDKESVTKNLKGLIETYIISET